MQINIRNVKEIMSDKLTMSQRGILITILLNKEDNPKITLAKCKVHLNFTTHKEDLIALHEASLISWSKYDQAKKSLIEKEVSSDVVEAITFLNNLYKRNLNPNTYNNLTSNILKNNSLEDVKKVIANRYAVWKDEPKMSMHLNPSTLFRPKNFAKYLDEVKHTREGESFVNASNLELEDKTPITMEIAKQLISTDTYNFKMYNTDGSGNKRGNGKDVVRYGKDIKRLITVQDIQEQHNGVREYLYYYNAKL
tara:strand:- start:330 stop:1085 length:756 start_codon:yes stop_codon:yes gene_type:complete